MGSQAEPITIQDEPVEYKVFAHALTPSEALSVPKLVFMSLQLLNV